MGTAAAITAGQSPPRSVKMRGAMRACAAVPGQLPRSRPGRPRRYDIRLRRCRRTRPASRWAAGCIAAIPPPPAADRPRRRRRAADVRFPSLAAGRLRRTDRRAVSTRPDDRTAGLRAQAGPGIRAGSRRDGEERRRQDVQEARQHPIGTGVIGMMSAAKGPPMPVRYKAVTTGAPIADRICGILTEPATERGGDAGDLRRVPGDRRAAPVARPPGPRVSPYRCASRWQCAPVHEAVGRQAEEADDDAKADGDPTPPRSG